MGVRNGEGNYPPKAAGHTKTICDEILFGSHLAKKRLGNQALFNISSTSCSRFQLSCEGSAGKRKPVPHVFFASHSGVRDCINTVRFHGSGARIHIMTFAI